MSDEDLSAATASKLARLFPSAISTTCVLRLLRRLVVREGLRLKDGGFLLLCFQLTFAAKLAEVVIGSDVWEWSSVTRSLGCSPFERRWTNRAYPLHYRFALAHRDIHIHPEIPAISYVPGAAAIERMIAVGERAAYLSFESLSKAQAA